ncbi:MAG: GtrA family protein [Clostridia bacterium]|nr:GtrA family protein [Clostridia bacterium]
MKKAKKLKGKIESRELYKTKEHETELVSDCVLENITAETTTAENICPKKVIIENIDKEIAIESQTVVAENIDTEIAIESQTVVAENVDTEITSEGETININDAPENFSQSEKSYINRKEKSKEVKRAIKFTLFSASAGVIQFVSFTLLNEFAHLKYWPAYLIALTLSVLWNFTINRKFTFKSANNVALAMLKVIGYYCLFTPLSTWWGDALTKIGWNEYFVLAFTMLINLITEFLFTRFVVYGKSVDTKKS